MFLAFLPYTLSPALLPIPACETPVHGVRGFVGRLGRRIFNPMAFAGKKAGSGSGQIDFKPCPPLFGSGAGIRQPVVAAAAAAAASVVAGR